MSYVIGVRLPKEKGGKLVFLMDDQEEYTVAEFATKEDAEILARSHLMCLVHAYEIVEIEF